ncbi:hypothetical protein [Streptomyces mobaraensis]|uniref:Uncharacterized protein n=1 Tax=Streptomyces mobaraensis TaxID=35621 RepID=A0A5N5VYS5_STRMB|nr:hypothetical protein [Streptomyces mobaraensis]KAB7834052.1 hypothetical protein FRZ00_30790 [Streptomyces mobaraensis]
MIRSVAVQETVAALRVVREQWGELLLAVEAPPADVWPPRQLAHALRAVDEGRLDVVDRAPLVLREHPAPVNLDALDTGLAVEKMIFDLADTLAAAVQHSTPGAWRDPRCWRFADPGAGDVRHAHGSRAHGLHFACVWVEGRVLDEDTAPERQLDGSLSVPLFAPLPEDLLHEARCAAKTAEGRLLRTLGLDARRTPIPDRACPWCGGGLELRTGADVAPSVTCSGGWACPAPVPVGDGGRVRVWEWRDLPELIAALGVGVPVG